jgi:hypothetical protein
MAWEKTFSGGFKNIDQYGSFRGKKARKGTFCRFSVFGEKGQSDDEESPRRGKGKGNEDGKAGGVGGSRCGRRGEVGVSLGDGGEAEDKRN